MTLNDVIAKFDIAPGAKTTIVAALILAVSALQWTGLLSSQAELLDVVQKKFLIPALAVTLGLKVVRPEGSPLVTGSGLAAAAAVAATLGLIGCTFALQIGPEGRYVNQSSEFKPGVCLAAEVGDWVRTGLGNCTETGASTETLEHPDGPGESEPEAPPEG